nr:hypothetical protein [uncultured Flavonifractor sp.]
MTDEELIRLYQARDPRAVEETKAQYGACCAAIARRLLTDARDVQDTPYLYAGENAGLSAYLIVGGTPENLGYAEVWINQGEVCLALRYGEVSAMAQLDPQQFREEMWRSIVELPWFNAGMEQLQEELEGALSAS